MCGIVIWFRFQLRFQSPRFRLRFWFQSPRFRLRFRLHQNELQMIPTPIPTPESESESSFDSDSGVGIAPGLALIDIEILFTLYLWLHWYCCCSTGYAASLQCSGDGAFWGHTRFISYEWRGTQMNLKKYLTNAFFRESSHPPPPTALRNTWMAPKCRIFWDGMARASRRLSTSHVLCSVLREIPLFWPLFVGKSSMWIFS